MIFHQRRTGGDVNGDNGGSLAPDGDASSPMVDTARLPRGSSSFFSCCRFSALLLLLRHTTKIFGSAPVRLLLLYSAVKINILCDSLVGEWMLVSFFFVASFIPQRYRRWFSSLDSLHGWDGGFRTDYTCRHSNSVILCNHASFFGHCRPRRFRHT